MQELFFDIETVPSVKWSELKEGLKRIWIEKHHYTFYNKELEFLNKKEAIKNNEINFIIKEKGITFEDIWNKYSPLFPEFGKVICISIGIIKKDKTTSIKTISENTEKETLEKFFKFLIDNTKFVLTGCNIKQFDMPFLIRKALQYDLELPTQLDILGKKPWEIKVIDLMEDYKSGMYNMVSLDLICEFLDIQTPKDKFANYEVSSLYMNGEIKKEDICEYCEKDIVATINLFNKIYK